MDIKSSSIAISTILRDENTYTVPLFQRNYSWKEEEQIEAFWNDLIAVSSRSDTESYFLGSMVFTPHGTGQKIKILDGQQRFATILLFLAALREELKSKNFSRGVEWTNNINRSIYFTDIATCARRMKLELNKQDKTFFERFITGDAPIVASHNSHELVKSAYEFFRKRISACITLDGEHFVEKVLTAVFKKLVIIRIDADSDVNANTLFETLNDRGLELSAADLIKNYLLALLSESEDEQLEVMNYWDSIIEQVGDSELTKFIRYYWLSKKGVVKKDELYKAVKSEIKVHNVKEFVINLRDESIIYSALLSPTSEYWADSNIKKLLEELQFLNVEQIYVLLMGVASKYKDEPATFKEILRNLINFTVRYSTICGLNPNALEKKYTDLSIKVRAGTIDSAGLMAGIKTISPASDLLIERFGKLEIKNSRLARYILTNITNRLLNDAGQGELSVNLEAVNLEHIIPKNPCEEWNAFLNAEGSKAEELVYKVGNLTLLLEEYNRRLANQFFSSKKGMYSQSKLPINTKLAQYSSFGSSQIDERQKELAIISDRIWSLDN